MPDQHDQIQYQLGTLTGQLTSLVAQVTTLSGYLQNYEQRINRIEVQIAKHKEKISIFWAIGSVIGSIIGALMTAIILKYFHL